MKTKKTLLEFLFFANLHVNYFSQKSNFPTKNSLDPYTNPYKIPVVVILFYMIIFS